MITAKLGIVLGLDNVAVALALGPLRLGGRRMAVMALLFGAAEALMPMAGVALGEFMPMPTVDFSDAARASVLITLGAAMLGFTLVRRNPAPFVGNIWTLLGLTLLLGLDNFLAGVALNVAGFSFATILSTGIVSGLLVFAACATSSLAAALVAPRWGVFASVAMLAAVAVSEIA